jgi:hypothetical protein
LSGDSSQGSYNGLKSENLVGEILQFRQCKFFSVSSWDITIQSLHIPLYFFVHVIHNEFLALKQKAVSKISKDLDIPLPPNFLMQDLTYSIYF